jgi:hypothetical protein
MATVIMVAHPTKAGVAEGKVPSLADIEGSMNWYNKCDNGLIVARDPEANTLPRDQRQGARDRQRQARHMLVHGRP